jgi:CHAT domain-containing protein
MGRDAALRLPGISEEERNQVSGLLDDIAAAERVLNNYNGKRTEGNDAKAYAEAGERLTQDEAELKSLDASIAEKLPRYKELVNPVPVTTEEAESRIDNNTAVLEYVIWDDSIDYKPLTTGYTWQGIDKRPTINSYCLVLTKQGVRAVRLPPAYDEKTNSKGFNYESYVKGLRDMITGGSPVEDMEYTRNALYKHLIQPVIDAKALPANIKNIIIVPDGNLAFLPFDILRHDETSPDFGDTYRLSMSPSVSVSILADKLGVTNNSPMLAFGGAIYNEEKNANQSSASPRLRVGSSSSWSNLPGTITEVNDLAKLPFKIAPTVYTGTKVSEQELKSLSSAGELAKYPLVHFACHGFFDSASKPEAGVVFSEVSGALRTSGDKEDGILTIPEIVLLNFRAKMVMLSACETGLGELKRGDGMVGLTRAFMVAGAEHVGVSLWSIPDEATAAFMEGIYKKVVDEGLSFKEAYYKTKEEFRNNKEHPEWAHPYFWAGFSLYE